MIELTAGPYTVRGISVGGIYTTLHVPELDLVLDAGLPLRSFATAGRFFLSHGHLDHVAGLAGLLNIRGLLGAGRATIHLPSEIEQPVRELLAAHGGLSRGVLDADFVPLRPGDVHALGRGLLVRAFRTHHPVPSLGYQFLRRVQKLRPEHLGLPPEELGRLRRAGTPGLFNEREQLELAYATDTLARVVETEPSILESRVLLLECTFIGTRRTVEEARERAHTHLDEIAAMADRFRNETLVLMHFGQTASPDEVRRVVAERLPKALRERVKLLVPDENRWFG